jgi:hypothetical protein
MRPKVVNQKHRGGRRDRKAPTVPGTSRPMRAPFVARRPSVCEAERRWNVERFWGG